MPVDPKPRLEIRDLTVFDEMGVKRLDKVSFTAMRGEILGIAGVAGSGQKELLESVAGLYPVTEGTITFYDPKAEADGRPATKNLVGMDPMAIKKTGVAMAFVPEDRLGMGLVGSMGMTGNMMLRSWRIGTGPVRQPQGPRAARPQHLGGARRRHPEHRTSPCAACPAATCRRCSSGVRLPSARPC